MEVLSDHASMLRFQEPIVTEKLRRIIAKADQLALADVITFQKVKVRHEYQLPKDLLIRFRKSLDNSCWGELSNLKLSSDHCYVFCDASGTPLVCIKGVHGAYQVYLHPARSSTSLVRLGVQVFPFLRTHEGALFARLSKANLVNDYFQPTPIILNGGLILSDRLLIAKLDTLGEKYAEH